MAWPWQMLQQLLFQLRYWSMEEYHMAISKRLIHCFNVIIFFDDINNIQYIQSTSECTVHNCRSFKRGKGQPILSSTPDQITFYTHNSCFWCASYVKEDKPLINSYSTNTNILLKTFTQKTRRRWAGLYEKTSCKKKQDCWKLTSHVAQRSVWW